MRQNYHTHTYRCHHATGTERNYIENAIASGMEVLGFSDHTPQFFPGEYYSRMRMRPEALEGYVSTLRALREEYAGRIEIKIGLEVEYYPHCFDALVDFLRPSGVEYLILGQHWVGEEQGETYNSSPVPPEKEEDRLARYTAQVLEGLGTGRFTYLAHPDLVRFDGDDAVYRRYMEPFCRELAAMRIPLEINFLGVMDRRIYPSERFFSIARDAGCRFVFGADAHQAAVLARTDVEAEARAFCARLGIVPEETVTLVDPTF